LQIDCLRLARDPRAVCKTERVVNAVEDGIFLDDEIYDRLCCASARATSISSGEHRA
jgi:hypothetical protein